VSRNDYVIEVHDTPLAIAAADWNTLLALQSDPTPFMRHEYLAAMHASGSATAQTGWTPRFITLRVSGGTDDAAPQALAGACALYLKDHSYGEYVFDHAWAHAYRQHGLRYYPKALVAPPFTPVPGARLLARNDEARVALAKGLVQWCEQSRLSSLHLLFASAPDVAACTEAGMMLRHNVQFHWTNTAPGYRDFDAFLASLNQEKRKKIRQERRKVEQAGVVFRCASGPAITAADWDFFYQCYARTYYEHGNAPYLSRDFFHRMARDMADNWLLFIGERQGRNIASSLIARSNGSTACTSRPATTSPCNGALPTATGASKAGRRASTRWPARCCRSRRPARTGWRTRHLPRPSTIFCSANVRASAATWPNSNSATRSKAGTPDGPRCRLRYFFAAMAAIMRKVSVFRSALTLATAGRSPSAFR
jgi:uncharacterized protein